MAHVEALLTFFQVQVERMRCNPMKLLQAMPGETPEALNAVEMMCAVCKLILAMIDSIVPPVPDLHQAIIAAPPVRMNNCLRGNSTANNGLQSSLQAVGHDLRIDTTFALQESEDRSLATCSTPAPASDTASAEVTFINLDFAGERKKLAGTLRRYLDES